MERIMHIPGVTHLTHRTIVENFGDTADKLLPAKLRELADLEYFRCKLIDKYVEEVFLPVHLMLFDDTSGYNQITKEIKNMRIAGIGKRKREVGLAVLPLEEVKQVPILDICEFKKIKRTGRRTMVSCPLHEDSSPSMLINTNNTWKCFSCGKKGSSIDLVMELLGTTFIEAVKHLQGVKDEVK